MHDPLAWIGLAGAGLCLATRLPGAARCWVPHSVALAVMLVMLLGGPRAAVLAGAAAVAAACAWTAVAPSTPGRAGAVVDLAAMALLTAASALPAGVRTAGHPMGMPMSGPTSSAGPGFYLLLIACWALARATVQLGPLFGWSSRSAGTPGRPGLWSALTRESGSLAMIVGMVAMLR